jgi:glycosyltransferase involved in cell wall biosynthesis
MLSVIIPAHDEEAVIGRCLSRLTGSAAADDLEIIVVANACTDRTVDIVARYAQVQLVEIPVANKPAALNAGDAAAHHFPRAYVDADVEVDADALLAVARALDGTGAFVGAPALRTDLTGCSWAVRAFYRIRAGRAWSTVTPVGSGIYVLSSAGHARFGTFPDLNAEDQYIHDLFLAEERACVAEHEFVMRPARNMRALVVRRTRELEAEAKYQRLYGVLPGRASGPGAVEVLRADPRRALDLAVVAGVRVAAMWRLRRRRRHGGPAWERDESSRVPDVAAS